jgi:hypothetical protein
MLMGMMAVGKRKRHDGEPPIQIKQNGPPMMIATGILKTSLLIVDSAVLPHPRVVVIRDMRKPERALLKQSIE